MAALDPSDQAIGSDPEFKRIFVNDLAEALKQGDAGMIRDGDMSYEDWGVRLEDIPFPIYVFHGTEDYIVPIQHGYHLRDHVPSCTLQI